MAKLSAYGRYKIAEFDTLCDRIAFMSDCTSLVNYGSGWKTGKKYPSMEIMLKTIEDLREEQSNINPFWASLKCMVHDEFALAFRHAIKRLLDEILEGYHTPATASAYMQSNHWSSQFNGKVISSEDLCYWASLIIRARNYKIGKRFPQTNDCVDSFNDDVVRYS